MKTLKLLIAGIFTMALSFGVKAQDKYEYAVITYAPKYYNVGKITISRQDKYEETEFKLSEGSASYNLTPVINVINTLSREGWDVYGTNATGNDREVNTYYYLRKKKN